jgi:4-hydroxybenzoate polyprenyltransferase
MSEVLPDAAPTNWVDRRAPEGLRPWLKLGRFDRPVGIWLLLLPGWWGIALAASHMRAPPDLRLLLSFAVGAALMRAAGCAYNDIVDRDVDAKVARTAARPVASGRISVRQAWAFVVGCSLVSLLILLTLEPEAVVLGIASLALVAAYPFMKRITWWPQAWLGLTFNWGALMGFAAAVSAASFEKFVAEDQIIEPATYSTRALIDVTADRLSGLSYLVDGWYVMPGPEAYLPAVLLYLCGVFWTLGYDTIYAVQDLEDDALAGVKSSARRLGPQTARGVAVFYAASVFFALLAGLAAGLGPLFLVGWAAFGVHLWRQARRIRLDDPELCLRLFKSNRGAGLILLAGIVAGGLWL